jgi:hypothetical protein
MGLSIMPFKHNADRRHHIPKIRLRVTNWRQYEAGLRRRGSLTRCRQAAKAGRRKTLTQQPSWRYSRSWRAPWSGYPENVHSFRQRSPLPWLLQERLALCMGRFVAALLEEDAEWLTWI